MKIKVIERGETEFTASTEWTEPDIRAALATEDKDDNVRSAIMDTTDTQRDTDSDEYITITEDDGTVLWSGWLTGRDDPAPEPASRPSLTGYGPSADALRLEHERDEAKADRRELAHLNASQGSVIRDLRASLSSLTDRAEADRVITGDEAAEFRSLTGKAVAIPPDPSPEDDAAAALLALQLPENDSGASTVRGYLAALLTAFWGSGEEGLDGKKPFGNSGWRNDLYRPMVLAGLVAGDEHGCIEYEAMGQADTLILAAIERLGQ